MEIVQSIRKWTNHSHTHTQRTTKTTTKSSLLPLPLPIELAHKKSQNKSHYYNAFRGSMMISILWANPIDKYLSIEWAYSIHSNVSLILCFGTISIRLTSIHWATTCWLVVLMLLWWSLGGYFEMRPAIWSGYPPLLLYTILCCVLFCHILHPPLCTPST